MLQWEVRVNLSGLPLAGLPEQELSSCRAGPFGKYPERILRWWNRTGGQGSTHRYLKLQGLYLSCCSCQRLPPATNSETREHKAWIYSPHHIEVDAGTSLTMQLISPKCRWLSCWWLYFVPENNWQVRNCTSARFLVLLISLNKCWHRSSACDIR